MQQSADAVLWLVSWCVQASRAGCFALWISWHRISLICSSTEDWWNIWCLNFYMLLLFVWFGHKEPAGRRFSGNKRATGSLPESQLSPVTHTGSGLLTDESELFRPDCSRAEPRPAVNSCAGFHDDLQQWIAHRNTASLLTSTTPEVTFLWSTGRIQTGMKTNWKQDPYTWKQKGVFGFGSGTTDCRRCRRAGADHWTGDGRLRTGSLVLSGDTLTQLVPDSFKYKDKSFLYKIKATGFFSVKSV